MRPQGIARGGQIAGGRERDGCGRADDRVRVRAQPAEQLRRLVRVAVVSGDAGRDANRRGAFGGIRGTEQTVGQCRRGRAVSGAGQAVGDLRSQALGAGVDRGLIQPHGPRGVAACGGGLFGEDAGQPVVAQAVFAESDRKVGRQGRHVEL